MKPVIQEEISGCGIACVAVLARVSYRRAKAVANRRGIFAEDERLWSETAYVRGLLRHFGIRTARDEQPFTTWDSLPNVALLAIKWHEVQGRPFWHWVVFARQGNGAVVFDSKRGLCQHVRTDLGRITPKWSIKVHLP